jgi:ADP-heptose:LPS heptosyltransferase
MDSFFYKKMNVCKVFKLKEGLGDCIIAASCIQEYARIHNIKPTYITSPGLLNILNNNPYFNVTDNEKDTEDIALELKWVSQLKENLYGLHTMQRFSYQLGFFIDPTKVVNLYNENKQIIKNKEVEKTICLNIFSKEYNRRFIPKKYCDLIFKIANDFGYKIEFIGDCGIYKSTSDIKEILKKLETTKLFIGPISFCYHLAASIETNCLTFFSYMPYWKFSHFSRTIPIYDLRECVSMCEEKEKEMRTKNNCFHECLATSYNEEEIERKLIKILS